MVTSFWYICCSRHKKYLTILSLKGIDVQKMFHIVIEFQRKLRKCLFMKNLLQQEGSQQVLVVVYVKNIEYLLSGHHHDLALVKFGPPLDKTDWNWESTENDAIYPICLPNKSYKEYRKTSKHLLDPVKCVQSPLVINQKCVD